MFGDKFTKLTAAIGRENHSEEQLQEINAQLLEKGLKGLAVVRQEDVTSIMSERDAAVKAKADAEKERDEWKKKAEEFGEQPGAVRTSAPGEGKQEKKDEYVSDPSHEWNQNANKALGLN